MNELEIIQKVQATCSSHPSVLLGIGDDAAVLKESIAKQLVCKDMLLDGVHFHVNETDPRRIGHKALAVNLSDIAAMGGVALSAYVALALPRALCHEAFLQGLYDGMEALARRFDLSIAGGDTNIWDGPFAISVTVVGSCHGRGPVLRSGAQEGDIIVVTGPLGDSYATGHHLDFTPRLKEAQRILDAVSLHSMIDLSDGLGKDLRLMCSQSKVRASLRQDSLPIRSSLQTLPRAQALEAALNDGEDFELCFTLAPDAWKELQATCPDLPLTAIGHIGPGEGLAWDLGSGQEQVILAKGYEHKADAIPSSLAKKDKSCKL